MASMKDAAARRRQRRSERGAELIELAIVLPILLIVLAGIIDFGFLFQQYETVTNAAREGARVAILPNFNDADTQERVRQYIDAAGLDRAQAVVPLPTRSSLTLTTGATVDVVTVQVSYPAQFSSLGPLIRLVGGSSRSVIMLRSSSVMRTENASSGGS